MDEPSDTVIAERTMESLRASEIWLAGLAVEASRRVLHERNETGTDAAVALQRALEAEIKRAVAALPDPLLPPAIAARAVRPETEREVDGMHERDAAAATYIEHLGSAPTADEWRQAARLQWAAFKAQGTLPGFEPNDWAQWRDNGRWQDRFARCLGAVLWETRVRAEVEAKRAKPPALVMAVYEPVLAVLRPGLRLEERNGQRVLFDRHNHAVMMVERSIEPVNVPALDLEAASRMLPRGVELLGRIDAHRVLRWEVVNGHRQVLEGCNDPRVLEWEGGWAALPDLVGGGKREELRLIVLAQAHLCWRWPDGSRGNMLSYNERRASGGSRGRVSLILGDVLMPGYVHALNGASLAKREGRRLVPIVDLPPLVGRPNEHGAQAAYQLQVVAEMRKRAVELYEDGGVLLHEEELEALAGDAGLAAGLWRRVIGCWTQGTDTAPAFLELVEPDRYTLAPAHAAAREYLVASGKLESEGAKAGRRGVGRKRAGRFGRSHARRPE